jgi:hypothetical protein
MTKETTEPTREEFLAYWRKGEEERSKFSWRTVRPYVIYIGGLALFAAIIRSLDPSYGFAVAAVLIAVAYIIAVPWLWIVTGQRRYAKFIRCHQCGDWLGRDLSGAWHGSNPNWKLIGETGKCTKCGTTLFTEH